MGDWDSRGRVVGPSCTRLDVQLARLQGYLTLTRNLNEVLTVKVNDGRIDFCRRAGALPVPHRHSDSHKKDSGK
jgi:hypothetical protein